jgi:hypothetical protein
MLTASTRASTRGLHGVFDSVIDIVTGKVVTSATAAAQPLLDDVEKRIKKLLMPVVIFTAGAFFMNLLTYREVRRTRAGKPLSGRR